MNLFAFQDIITGVAGVMLFVLLLLIVQMAIRTASASTEFGEPVKEPTASQAQQPLPDLGRLEELQEELKLLRRRGAELLAAENENLEADLNAAEAELKSLIGDADAKKVIAEQIASQVAGEVSQKKGTAQQHRDALQQKLEELEYEQSEHEGGKLVTFKAASSGLRELWLVDLRGSSAAIFNVEDPSDVTRVSFAPLSPAIMAVHAIRAELQERTKVRSIVVLMRPSVAGSGPEFLAAFRSAGYQVALELLDEDTRVTPPSRELP